MKFRLFRQVFSIEARKWMSYRADFWINTVVGFGANMAISWFLWQAIFRASGTGRVAGYTLGGMIAYYVLVILVGRVVRGMEMGGAISQEIYQGTYSRYVLYPVDFFSFKYAQHLGALFPSLVQLLVFCGLASLVLPLPPEIRVTPASLAMAAAAAAGANLLHFLLIYPVEAVAFWADNVWSLMVMMRFSANLLGGMLLPLDLYPQWAQRLLAWTPFPYLFYFPVKTLVGQVPFAAWLQGMALIGVWSVVLAAVGRAVWRRGDYQYTGVGI